ncbi:MULTISPECIES: M6 family metalloprotease domain-containing protein [unclassified Nocardioides]|uniref:M6 family metalloprotease domain-containing protein n=1 Tax=unclassified Nocardioides TaxID=2615069 RepID=UPI00361FCA89
MIRRAIAAASTVAVAAVLPVIAAPAQARPASAQPPASDAAGPHRPDNRPSPLATQRASLRQRAIDQLASGDARLKGRGESRTIQLAGGAEVDYPATQDANLLTFLVEFGEDDPADLASEDFPAEGPLHNEIPEPDAVDNTTYWKGDFNRQHFLDMFFNGMDDQGGESFKDLYDEMSSGRFDLTGDVSDWVQVPHAEAFYSDEDGFENQPEMTAFIGDSANAWYDARIGAGMTDAQIKDYLAEYDVWDRYDIDGDGDFNESDGYIDHFQAVHAGEGEEAGAPIWSIWSHRWSANIGGFGTAGPAEGSCDACYPVGGVEIGDSGYWIYDYTTEPENGGLGVFAHEFGHDLDLPDYYDTGDGDNSNGYWTLMDSGSWLGHGDGATGNSAGHMGPTEKLFLGWYGPQTPDGYDDLAVVDGTAAAEEVTLGPSYHATTAGKQAVLVTLPDGHGSADGPVDGDYLYSGYLDGNAVQATGPSIELSAGTVTLQANVNYDTEEDFDYAYLEVSNDGGATWDNVHTSVSSTDNPNGSNLGEGISGDSAGPVDITADLSTYAGQTVQLRWEFIADANTHGEGTIDGFVVDSLSVGDYSTTFEDTSDWTLSGFHAVADGQYSYEFTQYYMAENRTFDGYDVALGQGPYSHDYEVSIPGHKKVDHYSYEDGLLLYYSNSAYTDNNTSDHPGFGANLPVDANPESITWTGAGDPATANGRLQAFDATFDVDSTHLLSLTREVPGGTQSVNIPARPSVPVFEDNDVNGYWSEDPDDDAVGWFSTKVAGAGTTLQVVSSDKASDTMVIKVGKNFIAQVNEPFINGPAAVGKQLTLEPGWFQKGVTNDVTWFRDGVEIGNAGHGTTYTAQPADVGHEITAAVTATKSGYVGNATEVTDGPTVVTGAAPSPTVALAIQGAASVGSTLTAAGATWPVAGSSTFAWTIGGVAVGTGASYAVNAGDAGKVVTVTETRTSPGYETARASASTAPVAAGAEPVASAPPTISGKARVGSTLKVTAGTWPRAGTSTFTWTVGGKQVGTGTAYEVKPANAGKTVTVTETFVSPGYAPGTASAVTAKVLPAKVSLSVDPGKATKGKKVKVVIKATSPGLTVPGTVKLVYAGEKLGGEKLDDGKVTVHLPAKPKGTYKLKVSLESGTGFADADDTVEIKVKRK